MIGFDMWSAAVTSWNKPRNGAMQLANATLLNSYLADIRKTAPHVNTLRFWCFQQFALNNGSRDWAAIDKVLNVAKNHGFKVIATLEDAWGYEEYGSQQPAKTTSWFNGGYKTQVMPETRVPYRQWVSDVVTRYAGDPRIAVWELMNEPNNITHSFIKDITGLIKSIDPVTLTCCGEAGALSSSAYALPTLDCASYHYYTDYRQTNWKAVQAAAAAAGKPWYIGECGFDSSLSHATRASDIKSLASSVFAHSNSAGFLYWQYAESGGDGFDMTKGDPALPILNSYVL
jgi:endo-1,4-beta-mannosidase